MRVNAAQYAFGCEIFQLRAIELRKFLFGNAEHAGQLERLAFRRLRLHRERLEELVLDQKFAHLFGTGEVGFVFEQQLFTRLPFGARLAAVVEQLFTLVVDRALFDAGDAFRGFVAVDHHARHAERIAAHIGRHIGATVPGVVPHDEQVLLRSESRDQHRRVGLALIATDKYQRVIAAGDRKFGVADRDRIHVPEGHRQRRALRQQDPVGLRQGNDFLETVRRRNLRRGCFGRAGHGGIP